MPTSRSADGRMVEWSPDRCPDGHPLGAHQVLVGWQPCGCAGTHGHRTWRCRACGATIYEPPHVPGPRSGPRS